DGKQGVKRRGRSPRRAGASPSDDHRGKPAGARRTGRLRIDGGAHTAAILRAAQDGGITIDHQGRVLEFNPAAARIFGYPRAVAIGARLDELIIPRSFRAAHRQGLARCAAGRESRLLGKRVEMVAVRADGSEFPVELTVTRINTEGPMLF